MGHFVKKEQQSDIFVNAQRHLETRNFCGSIYPFSCSWEGEY